MSNTGNSRATAGKNTTIQKLIIGTGQAQDMPRQERKQLVIDFMASHELALPSRAIFRNLRLKHNATFARRTLTNYLDDLVSEGYLMRIAPAALEERRIKPAASEGYYLISDSGKEVATKL